MPDLETLLEELPQLADSMKLTIGNSTEIRREIEGISNIQNKLNIIENKLQEVLNSERFNKGVLGAIPFFGTIASFFIPGGFVEGIVAGGSKLLADKLGDPDKETSLLDLIKSVEHLIEWGDTLKELAEKILNDSQLLTLLEWKSKSQSLPAEVRQIDKYLRINIAFDEEQTLRQQVQQIKAAQELLKQVHPKLDIIVQYLERNVDIIELLKALISYFGESVFAIEWWDEEEGLIISYEDQTTTVRIIFNECVSLKEKANTLNDRANSLRGQAEQSLKHLEKERRHKEQKKPSRKQSERSTQTAESLNPIDRTMSSGQRRGGRSGWILILSTLTLGVLGFIGWKTTFQISPSQQTIANSGIPLNIGEQKPNSEASPTLTPTPQPDPTATNLAAAQKLAMEAAVMTQNPPHPLENWQQVQGKWQESIKLLEAIPDNSPVATQAQEKLTVYRTNSQAITNRIVTEQKAVTNLEVAQKLAGEAAVMVNNPPQSKEVWQNAISKLQQAINLLNAIPQGTFVEAQAKEKLADYQNNYTLISNRIKTESP